MTHTHSDTHAKLSYPGNKKNGSSIGMNDGMHVEEGSQVGLLY